MNPFDVGAWIPTALLVHVIAACATLAVSQRPRWCRAIAFGGSALASLLTMVVAAQVLTTGVPLHGVLFTHAASGLVIDYAVTPVSAWFLLLLGGVSVPVATYSVGYLARAVPASRSAAVGIAYNVLIASVEAVFVVDHVIGFLFAWELMTLATAALVATEHESRRSRRAAYVYLIMSHVGTGALVAAFFTLVSASGSLSLSTVLSGHIVSGPLREALFWLFLLGFGVKAGVIPLHIWLPEAHPAAPSSISALMSAALIKAGVYGIFRVCAFGLGTPDTSWGLTCMGLGTLSAVLGVLYALAQNDLKRLLAYSTIENAGIMLLGLGAGMTMLAAQRPELAVIAIAATLYHALNHSVFKGLLFLAAGNVVLATGTRRLEDFGGLLQRMPWTGALFLVGALSISAVPPFNGFVSEWLTFQSLLLGFQSIPGLTRVVFPLAGAFLALTSALAAVCFVKAFGISFLALPRSAAATHAHEAPRVMVVPLTVLAACCLALGVLPGIVVRALGTVTTSLPGLPTSFTLAQSPWTLTVGAGPFGQVTPSVLGLTIVMGFGGAGALVALTRLRQSLRRAPTWGCGGSLSARTEYTSMAFSKPLLMVFRGVYRPARQLEAIADVSPYFRQELRYRVEIEPTFERHLYDPLVRIVIRAANRMKVLQAGSLHAYLGYVLLLGAVLLIWLGGM